MKRIAYTLFIAFNAFFAYAQICLKNPFDFSFDQISGSNNYPQKTAVTGDFDNDGNTDIITGSDSKCFLFFKGGWYG